MPFDICWHSWNNTYILVPFKVKEQISNQLNKVKSFRLFCWSSFLLFDCLLLLAFGHIVNDVTDIVLWIKHQTIWTFLQKLKKDEYCDRIFQVEMNLKKIEKLWCLRICMRRLRCRWNNWNILKDREMHRRNPMDRWTAAIGKKLFIT